MKALLLLALSLAPASAARPSEREVSGEVVGVSDGDTVTVLVDGKGVKVRLHGVDCPENRQAYGSRAKSFTSGLVFGREVRVRVVDRDRYQRLVGVVVLEDGRVLNRELVREGLAWWYRQYAPRDAELSRLEDEARAAKKGLWSDAQEPVPPWSFRRKQAGRPGV